MKFPIKLSEEFLEERTACDDSLKLLKGCNLIDRTLISAAGDYNGYLEWLDNLPYIEKNENGFIVKEVFNTVSGNDIINTYVWDERGRKVKSTKGLRDTVEYTYDDRDNLICRSSSFAGKTFYTYDERNNRTLSRNLAGYTIEKVYDENNLLIKVIGSKSNGVQDYVNTFEYDDRGNLTKSVKKGNIYLFEYDENNNCISETYGTDGPYLMEYDKAGNLIKETYPGGRVNTQEYDEKNRLIKIVAGEVQSTYEYNNFDHVIRETLNDDVVVTDFFWENDNIFCVSRNNNIILNAVLT